MENEIQLGSRVRIKNSPVSGVVVARIEYLGGRVQYAINPTFGTVLFEVAAGTYFAAEDAEVIELPAE